MWARTPLRGRNSENPPNQTQPFGSDLSVPLKPELEKRFGILQRQTLCSRRRDGKRRALGSSLTREPGLCRGPRRQALGAGAEPAALRSSCHFSRLRRRAFMKKLLTVASSRPSCWEMVTCISLDGRLFSWKMAESVRRCRSVKTKRDFFCALPRSLPGSCSLRLQAGGEAGGERSRQDAREHPGAGLLPELGIPALVWDAQPLRVQCNYRTYILYIHTIEYILYIHILYKIIAIKYK